MSDMTEVVDRYLATWNETDPTARREAVAALWREDAVYVDPLVSVAGHDGVDAVIAGAQEQFAGMRFERGDTFDAHHDTARFTWNLVPAGGGEALVVGFDVAVLGADGRLAGVYGFIDRMPPPA